MSNLNLSIENCQNETEGSGWVHDGVTYIEIINFILAKRMEQLYGSFVEYPPNLRGGRSILNVNCGVNDCVRTACTLHFIKREYWNIRTKRRREDFLKKSKKEYFKIPADMPKPIAIEDFDRLEKINDCNIFIYEIGKDESSDDNVRPIRIGKNPKVDSDRWIYLYNNEDTNHVGLITDIQKFLRAHSTTHFTKSKEMGEKICTICMNYVSRGYERHFKQCYNFKSVHKVIMPKEGSKFKFTAHDATVQVPLVAYFDTESKLVPSSEIPNAYNKHELISYMYVILNDKGDLKAIRKQTGGENLGRDFIVNLLEDYERLYEEYKSGLDPDPKLTNDDLKNHIAAKTCQNCKREFGKKSKRGKAVTKVRHHDWTVHPIYDNGVLVKGNYIGALCQFCNLNITQKLKTLPCIAHNGSKYDIRHVIAGIEDERVEIYQSRVTNTLK